ncbi:hypothetical protein NMG29_37930 [Streptomyces cocklensis]|jgi:hypothetical protein|uniref:Uncharacterized protein n=1 Tax=Actinacidiphila cocklensis TaxID=887465 RepID=A0A9W4GPS7_9ACTN|nr:hypothetical protein [Actinacidiphila cocklensis]MDD1063879.1 hypothetical protein [Actinacidiphila cocklensis]WSX73154.1 hypothetical protein OH826_04405 [Streptomyces sp. NBC_00899]WSX80780.1 hypothetical protein OH826_47105 [Streptomyces sp. NBC_00899]CAG6392562.1 hypothetical protein SCOCK_170119 [Actinacidiphila cocklensis]
MGPTLLVSVGVLALGVAGCLFVRRLDGAPADPHGLPMTDEEIAAADAAGAGGGAGAVAGRPRNGSYARSSNTVWPADFVSAWQ